MKNWLLISLLFVFRNAFSQDIHLSQFYNSDHLLNPSKVGDYDGDYRVALNYRNQWSQVNKQPISTYLLSFDHLFYLMNHEFDAGIMVASDRFAGKEFNIITNSNVNYSVNTNKFLLSLGTNYKYGLNKFRAGIQTGLVTSASDPNTQTYDNQWDYSYGDFNTSWASMETQLVPSQQYWDLNLGAQWTRKIWKIEPTIGFSVNHINRPKDSFLKNNKERLRARKVFFIDLSYPLTSTIALQPKLFFMWTAKANDFILGSNVRKATQNKKVTSVYLGLFYRHGVARIFDAISPSAGFKYKKFDIGLSYDINLSSLSSGTNSRKGTFELSAIYTGASTMPKKIFVPCDRY
jgi:type IX secretion system PorP/SprF family membrane protein